MSMYQRGLVVLMALGVAACSGIVVVPPGSDSGPIEPNQEVIEFPPTWTPTVKPPRSLESATPEAAEDAGDQNSSSTFPDLSEATSVAASSPTSSWQRAEGATASFMLPGSFEVLDMGSEFGMLMAALMGGLVEGMMEIAADIGEEMGAEPITPPPIDLGEVEAAFSIDFVLAMQADQKTSAFLFSEPLEGETTLEEQVQATLDEQDNPVEIVSLDRVSDSIYEMARMHLLVTDSETGERGQVLIYIILNPERVYQLGYTTDADRYEEMLPIFETSASTFRIGTE